MQTKRASLVPLARVLNDSAELTHSLGVGYDVASFHVGDTVLDRSEIGGLVLDVVSKRVNGNRLWISTSFTTDGFELRLQISGEIDRHRFLNSVVVGF